MKFMVIATLMLFSFSALADFDNKSNREVAQGLVQSSGYRCDTVDSLMQSAWSGVISIHCNGFRYSYEIEDIGGRWTVTVD